MIVGVLTTCHKKYTWDRMQCFLSFNRTILQVSATYLTGPLYVHPFWFYRHQHDNRVRSKLFVACQRRWFQWRFWFLPSVPEYFREEEEHKPDPWRNLTERNHMGVASGERGGKLLKPRQSSRITLYKGSWQPLFMYSYTNPTLTTRKNYAQSNKGVKSQSQDPQRVRLHQYILRQLTPKPSHRCTAVIPSPNASDIWRHGPFHYRARSVLSQIYSSRPTLLLSRSILILCSHLNLCLHSGYFIFGRASDLYLCLYNQLFAFFTVFLSF